MHRRIACVPLLVVLWLVLVVVMGLVVAMGLAGCGGSSGAPKAKQLTAIAVTPPTISLTLGTQQQLQATGTYDDGSQANLSASVTWTSSDTTKSTVNASGLVTTLAAGSCTITAASGNISGSSSITISRTQTSLLSITVTPSGSTIVARGQKQLQAMGTYDDNSKVDLTGSATWRSSDSTKAQVNASGLVTAMALGGITISATSGTTSGTAPLQVVAPTGVAKVLTWHNDNTRSGLNSGESALTLANVNQTRFGLLYRYSVDGQVYAQPLYVPNLSIGSVQHNVVFVATEHNSVYAFDADGLSNTPLWHVSLGQAVSNNDPEGVSPELGITSTPAIDLSKNAMYVLAVTPGRVFTLHALDIRTGADKLPPVEIKPTVPGTGADSVNGSITLESGCYQRSAITLANNRVYLAFGHCSHGWVVAYDTALQFVAALNTSPDGKGAAIWMSGAGPAVDSTGNLYYITGVDADSTPITSASFQDSFVKLSPDLMALDSFSPSNESFLRMNDADLGSGAPILMPDNSSAHPHQIIGGGKDGRIFVLDRDNLGGFKTVDGSLQEVQTGTQQFDNLWSAPALWNGNIYYHPEADVLKAYSWSAGLLSTSPVGHSSTAYQMHGASPSISANGSSNGIVWEVEDTGYPSGPAILHAYSAADVSSELYNSSQAGQRDTAGQACKFSNPTVADGKVFVPTSTQLNIYGLLP